MWGYPGKKLLFMGQEFAQRNEWNESRALDWGLIAAPAHDGVRRLVRDLNKTYRERPALHARDCEAEGFAWAIADDNANSVFAWTRMAPGAAPVLIVSNMTPVVRQGYRVPVPANGRWRELINSDALQYGGSGQSNAAGAEAKNGGLLLTLPPLATIMLEHET